MKTKLIALLPWKYLALACAAALGLSSTAKAQIQLDFVFNSATGRTTATYSGTWAVDSDDVNNTAAGTVVAESTAFQVRNTVSGTSMYGLEGGIVGPYAWSAEGGHYLSGDNFGFTPDWVYGPIDFTAATLISGSAYWDKNLTEMGFDAAEILAGGGSYSGPGGTVNWTVSGAVAVPESSTYAAFLGGAALLLCIMRRRGERW
jgi:hypothetical protein